MNNNHDYWINRAGAVLIIKDDDAGCAYYNELAEFCFNQKMQITGTFDDEFCFDTTKENNLDLVRRVEVIDMPVDKNKMPQLGEYWKDEYENIHYLVPADPRDLPYTLMSGGMGSDFHTFLPDGTIIDDGFGYKNSLVNQVQIK